MDNFLREGAFQAMRAALTPPTFHLPCRGFDVESGPRVRLFAPLKRAEGGWLLNKVRYRFPGH
jgi:hypothetical protein